MIGFAPAFTAFEIGDQIVVSDGRSEPRDTSSHEWKVWRSSNFTGLLVDKIDLAPRAFVVEIAVENATVRYTIEEGRGHRLAVPDEVLADDPPARLLSAMESELLVEIDWQAGEFRKRFITDVPGQSQTYAEKEREARAYLADPEGSFPFLTAEATARGATIEDVAALIMATADNWRLLGAAIEGTRMGAKAAVEAASTWAAKQAAAIVDWEGLLS